MWVKRDNPAPTLEQLQKQRQEVWESSRNETHHRPQQVTPSDASHEFQRHLLGRA